MGADTAITLGEINRARLARQHLLARSEVGALEMVRWLIALQAQAPWAPYYGLWSRLEGFDPTTLADALQQRSIVRSTSLRGTIHLAATDDASDLFTFSRPVIDRTARGRPEYGALVDGPDAAAILDAAAALLRADAITGAELGGQLAARWPAFPADTLWQFVRAHIPLVQVTPRAVWGRRGAARWQTLDAWAPSTTSGPIDDLDERLILRYLRAYGPATVADIQTWVSRTRFAEVVQRLAPQLVRFAGPDGTYWDVPDAPRPPADTPAPPRLLAPFDNLLLGYRNREAMMSSEAQQRLFAAPNGQIPGAVMVDGQVVGEWALAADTPLIAMSLYGPQPKDAIDQLAAEAARLRSPTADESPLVVRCSVEQ